MKKYVNAVTLSIFTVWVIIDKLERCVNRTGRLSADNNYMDNVRGQVDVKHKFSTVVLPYILQRAPRCNKEGKLKTLKQWTADRTSE